MVNHINWQLLAKYLSSESSEKENVKVTNWLEADAENQKLLDTLKGVWEQPFKPYEPSDVKALWSGIAEKAGITGETKEQIVYKLADNKQKESIFSSIFRFSHMPVLRYAAILLIILFIPILYFLLSIQKESDTILEWKTIIVDNSEQFNLTLNDGTKLFLDSGSRVQIPENFGSNSRQVKLKGEAYFEVNPDPENPFTVYSSNAVIKVLGTKFNVRAWQETGKVEVTVTEGKVSFGADKKPEKEIILNKGFAGSLTKTGELSAPEEVDLNNLVPWMKGEMSFDDVPFSEILAQVERWYNVQFKLEDSTIVTERLAVSINKNSLTEVLEILSTLTNTQYRYEGKIIILETTATKK